MRLIDADAIHYCEYDLDNYHWFRAVDEDEIAEMPTIDAVPVEQFNDIREDFIDYVCSGVPNPAPYCGNATEKCVDARGWCVKNECNGFTPRGERKE